MDFLLTRDERQLKEAVRDFARTALRPFVESPPLPSLHSLLDLIDAQGWRDLLVPFREEDRPSGLRRLILLEEISAAAPSAGLALANHSPSCMSLLDRLAVAAGIAAAAIEAVLGVMKTIWLLPPPAGFAGVERLAADATVSLEAARILIYRAGLAEKKGRNGRREADAARPLVINALEEAAALVRGFPAALDAPPLPQLRDWGEILASGLALIRIDNCT